MSSGGQDPGTTPIQTPTPPAPVFVTKSLEDRLWAAAPILLMVGLMFAVNRGWLKPEQADAIQKTIPIVLSAPAPASPGDPGAVSVTTGKDDDGRDSVVVKPTFSAPPAAFDPSELDKWLPFVQKIAEVVKPIFTPPAPAPAPSPTPLPGPVDPPKPTPSEQALIDQIKVLQDAIAGLVKPPAPTPIPDPIPAPTPKPIPGPGPVPDGSAKILITDEQGKAITASTVEPGVLFRVGSTVKPENCGWSVSRNGDVSAVTLANGSGFVCALRPGAWVEFHLTDFVSRQQVVARISCNQGPQPPPKPVDPGPTPIPTTDLTPKPKPAGDLRVVIVFESAQNHTREQLNVLNSTTLTDALNSKCSKGTDGRADWRRWDKDTAVDPGSAMGAMFQAVLPKAKEVGLPAIAVACGSESTVYPIPPNVSESQVLALLACGK